MSGNWVKINRSLLNSDLWKQESFTRGQAWVDLILLANYAEGFIRARGIKIIILRGQVGVSQVELSKRWKWSRGKVNRFLNELETEEQIEQQKNNVNSVITIVNYERYQGVGTADDTANDQQSDSKQDTNKKNKKNEKNKEEKEKRVILPFESKEFSEAWDKWKIYKKEEFSFAYKSEVSEKTALTALLNSSNENEATAIKMIDQAIVNGWKGIYELKNESKSNNQPQQQTRPSVPIG